MARRPLVQLTLLRFREFVREPEALFWTLVFPVILTTGLGVAFRNQAPDVVRIAAVTPAVADALARDPLLLVDRLDVADGPPRAQHGTRRARRRAGRQRRHRLSL